MIFVFFSLGKGLRVRNFQAPKSDKKKTRGFFLGFLELEVVDDFIFSFFDGGVRCFSDMTCIQTGHITTMEQQKARSQQRNGLGIALVGRLAHIL